MSQSSKISAPGPALKPGNPLWLERSWHVLLLEALRLRTALEGALDGKPPEYGPTSNEFEGSALAWLSQKLGLNPLERDLMVLCAAVCFDFSLPELIARIHHVTSARQPTFALALSCLSLRPDQDQALLEPNSPLRRYGLVRLPPKGLFELGSLPHTLLPLNLDPHIYHLLSGGRSFDFALTPYVKALETEGAMLSTSQQLWLEYVLGVLEPDLGPLMQLVGPHRQAGRNLAREVAKTLERPLYRIVLQALPNDSETLAEIALHVDRQQRLDPVVWLLDLGSEDLNFPGNEALRRTTHFLLEQLEGHVFLLSRQRIDLERDSLTLDLSAPTPAEQFEMWMGVLSRGKRDKKTLRALEPEVKMLTEQFDFGLGEIRSLALEALSLNLDAAPAELRSQAWDAGRRRNRPRLERLAQRIEPAPSSHWDRLILPDDQKKTLRAMVDHVRQRGQVYSAWGWSRDGQRGLGMTALFAGASGTGKTLAAETVAQALELDLFRIDLSSMVSKYVGETEKNLALIFDAAEVGGSVLLFDEADALFGKRGEVKESQDRYANIEVSYLLQRMEAFRGLAILTTNLESSLDEAFLRRLRFVVRFPVPEKEERVHIWQNVFPSGTPIHSSVNFIRLSQLEVSGGNIRNIALNAAFTASSETDPKERIVQMRHLLWAAQDEVRKLKRLLRPFEIEGW